VVHAGTREEAMDKMIRAIRDYEIVGVETTLGFCEYVMGHEAFRSGNFDTHFVKNHFTPDVLRKQLTAEEAAVAALIGAEVFHSQSPEGLAEKSEPVARGDWNMKRV
jgi:propionyl-CoA carboxylase alpha chain